MWLALLSAPQFNEVETDSDQLSVDDLIYTTRQYYFDISDGCLSDELCVSSVSLIITMDVGVTMKDEVKKAAFRKAELNFLGASGPSGQWQKVECPEYAHKYDSGTMKVEIRFAPDYASEVASRPVTACVFNGIVREKGGIAGQLSFTLPSGRNELIRFN